jgi:hypothetical protein
MASYAHQRYTVITSDQKRRLQRLVQSELIRTSDELLTTPTPSTVVAQLLELRYLHDEINNFTVLEDVSPLPAPPSDPQSAHGTPVSAGGGDSLESSDVDIQF